jgi:cytochrome c556
VCQNRVLRITATLTILLMASAVGVRAQGQDRLAAFMQAKLTHAEKTLEGLAKADYDLIVKHSQAISLLCEDELWAVLETPEYRERSNEFRRNVNAITDAGRKKNLEAATLAYVNATMNCVTCHKYVRETRPKK